jgi:hypothetical protein
MANSPSLHLSLSVLPSRYTICRLPADAPAPAWALLGALTSITRTPDELSIVCPEEHFDASGAGKVAKAAHGWRIIKVEGPLDFALSGILARLAGVLAQAGISLFALSTYDTDYILVQDESLDAAVEALRVAGYGISLMNNSRP